MSYTFKYLLTPFFKWCWNYKCSIKDGKLHLTSRVWTSRLRRKYLCPQWPPCSSGTQNTQGGTCVLRRPATRSKPADPLRRREKKSICRDPMLSIINILCSVLPWPLLHSERWHSGNTCFTLSLSGICSDVILGRSEPFVAPLLSSFSPSLTLAAHDLPISLSVVYVTLS